MVKIYAVDCSRISDDECIQLYNMVSLERKIRSNRLRFRINAIHGICGELLAHMLCRQTYNLPSYEPITFATTQRGKPYIMQYPHFHFNVSHSGQWVVCATAEKEIGIDVEEISVKDLEVARYVLSDTELTFFSSLSDEKKVDYLFYIFTAKESYLKFLGIGLNNFINQVIIKDDHVFLRDVQEPCKIYCYDIGPSYKIATCSTDTENVDSINYVSTEKFLMDDISLNEPFPKK